MNAIQKMDEAVHCLYLELDSQIVSDVKDKWLKVKAEIERLRNQLKDAESLVKKIPDILHDRGQMDSALYIREMIESHVVQGDKEQ